MASTHSDVSPHSTPVILAGVRARPPFSSLLLSLLILSSPTRLPLLQSAPSPDPVASKILNSDPLEARRLEALHQLERAGSLTPSLLLKTITDISPTLRAEALRIAIPLASGDPELELRLLALSHDTSPEVRRKMLPFLASSSNPKARPLFLTVALKSVDHPSLWPLALPPWGKDLTTSLSSLCQIEPARNLRETRTRFLIVAANHVREHLPRDSVETVLRMIPRADLFPRWSRIALLKGLLGHTEDAPAEFASRQKSLTFDSIPEAIQEVLRSKEKELQKVLQEPNPALVWPHSP